jgi:hypothetical protein
VADICLTTHLPGLLYSLLLDELLCMSYLMYVTWTYTQHRDNHDFCPCNLSSESIINPVTAVLCVLCYYSVSKHCFFVVSACGCILVYTCNVIFSWGISVVCTIISKVRV